MSAIPHTREYAPRFGAGVAKRHPEARRRRIAEAADNGTARRGLETGDGKEGWPDAGPDCEYGAASTPVPASKVHGDG